MDNGNRNIVLIQAIENYLMLINSNLRHLSTDTKKQASAQSQAFEEIDLFSKTTLTKLRSAYE